ncbi:hypothetical protein An13g03410 [Aspergillus niger]|uniref:Uncharacterized protein n=2 Tax=Aspergillus niger TaxID=5061 RepID=A2R237_ASPNC|nr:hypothetical protein An13g03410 [Aspergillus niger]CAK41737.1 hypothetical protein An13g03410 [Aspergillus niger]
MLVCPILGPQEMTPWPPIGSRQQLKRFRQLPRGQSVDLSITCPLCSNEKNQDFKMTAILSNILDRSLARSHRKKDLSNTIVIRDRATAISPQAIFDASCIRDTPQEKPYRAIGVYGRPSTSMPTTPSHVRTLIGEIWHSLPLSEQ